VLPRCGLRAVRRQEFPAQRQLFTTRWVCEVLARAGCSEEAEAALEQALERCERKKNLALARQVRERLVELRAETQPAL
jgi:hypothetical protein